MDTKINDAIKNVLQQFSDRYFIEGVLNKNKVIQDLDGYDRGLLEAFVSDEVLRSHFTIDVAGNIVIQTNKLIDLFEADEYWKDSYTRYSKKIGLTAGGNFIDEATDVVLDFPYKDTVLKASMSKEDTDKGDVRPDEPFLNEVIAKEEIDTLLDKKILVNAKKYDVYGEHEIKKFNEDDNLIMKGNNLLALHTLKDKYAGKIKLIYIDPPFNTGNDSFKYNDKFNKSTWLTFMKNRLEIALELLKDDGTLFLHVDDNEVHYAKVLLDEIFGIEKFINMVSVKLAEASGVKMSHINKRFLKTKDSILIYNKGQQHFNPIKVPKKEWDTEYNKIFLNLTKEDREIINNTAKNDNVSIEDIEETDKILANVYSSSVESEYNKTDKSLSLDEWRKENAWRIYRTAASSSVKKLVEEKKKTTEQIFFSVLSKRDKKMYIAKSDYSSSSSSPRVQILFANDYLTEYLTDFWNDIPTTGLEAEGGVDLKNGKKPEKLLQRIIQFASNPKDIVLDFFMGSSTTQAVAHKMNRRYIGIEQMNYIDKVSVPRLQKVIEGEQGGISKEVKWQGGGSFIYAELMEKNRGFLKAIQDAKTQTDLNGLLEFMLEEAEIDFRVDLEEVKESLNELSFNEQKKTLIGIIDKNQLYYNYSEIDDENVRDLISDEDYAFNQSFYEGERE